MEAIDILKSLLPVAGTVIGGPIGGAAAKWLADKVGVPADDITGIVNAVSGMHPDEKKALEQEFAKWSITEQNRMLEVYLADTQNARARDVEFVKAGRTNKRANFIVGVTFAGILSCVAVAVGFADINDFGKTLINVVIGVLLADWKQITSFEFGTTKESKDKNETINNLSKG